MELQSMVLGLGIPVQEEHIGGMKAFLDTMEFWGMPASEDGICRAARFLHRLHHNGYYSTALQIPCILNNKEGTLIAVSTAASTARMMHNMEHEAAGRIIVEPHWMLYDTYWFEGLAPLNFVGMTKAVHDGRQLKENLGMLVAKLSAERRIADWRVKYLVCAREEYLYGLRLFIHEAMGCRVWIEMTFGLSMQAYNALDMYVSVFTLGIQPPRESAWYLINDGANPLYRPERGPEDFWLCMAHMTGMGQKPMVSEWTLMNNVRMQVRQPYAFRYSTPGMRPPSRM